MPCSVWLAIGFIVIFGGGTYAAAHLGILDGRHRLTPAHPIDLIAGLIKGRVPWPVQSTVAAALMAGVVLVLAIVVLVAWRKGASKRARVDKAARYLGRGKSLAAFSEKGAKATAERLGVTGTPGIVVGKVVSTGQTFIQSWEDLSLDIWGPRTGKSTSRVMPAILDAPGAVVSTSNKRDVVDGTRGVREATGPGVGVRSAEDRPGRTGLVVEPALLRHRRREGLQAHPALLGRFTGPGVQAGRLLRPQSRRHPLLVLPRGRARASFPSRRSTCG